MEDRMVSMCWINSGQDENCRRFSVCQGHVPAALSWMGNSNDGQEAKMQKNYIKLDPVGSTVRLT